MSGKIGNALQSFLIKFKHTVGRVGVNSREDDEAEAEVLLAHLLNVAATRLSRLQQPAAVMFYPDREATREPADWSAAQVGEATWEQCLLWGETGTYPGETLTAREVLTWLHPAWLDLVARAFSLPPRKRVLAVVSQHGAQWLVLDHGEYSVFLIGQNGELDRIGEAFEDLDRRLGQTAPLVLKRIDPAAWPILRSAVPDFPVPDGLIREKS
jgi:hypothetical protein